ncbi:MAG: insulinase family protein [Bacteroidales bacterium]|nr:insulinase family protein [Candidatus Cryptobacteroides equifaecalis]
MRIIGPIILFITFSLALCGQELPSLPKDPAISKGVLPNGVEYYLVKNKERVGRADFALVQKGFCNPELSRSMLNELPHFPGRKAYRFFSSNGAKCSEKGYISYSPEATRFDFRDMPLYDKAVTDTAVMMLFDIASSSRGRQAVVIAGDIVPEDIHERLILYSLLLEQRGTEDFKIDYEWKPTDTLAIRFSRNRTENLAAIHVMCRSMRAPENTLGTALPLVSRMMARQLGKVLEERLRFSFRKAGIPLADVRFKYSDEMLSTGDVMYRFSIYTSASEVNRAAALVSAEIGDLDRYGAGIHEFSKVRKMVQTAAYEELSSASETNAGYVDKCVSSYLFGTSLASPSALPEFIVSRNLPEDRELGLFNGYVQALLDRDRNMYVRFDLPEGVGDESAIVSSYKAGWYSTPASIKPLSFNPDKLQGASGSRLKLKSDAAEPISGGRLWTFSNGMRVVYKNTPGSGRFSYALMVNGGYTQIKDLRRGEEEYVGGMLWNSNFNSISGEQLLRGLAMNGINMKCTSTLSDLRLTGDAPARSFPTVMRALLTVSNNRRPDIRAFEQMRREAPLRKEMARLAPRNTEFFLEEKIFPDYPFNRTDAPVKLPSDFQARTEVYFMNQFSRLTDGVLVLIGDLPAEELQKDLCRYLGGFATERRFAPRPMLDKTPVAGTRSYADVSGTGVIGALEMGSSIAFCIPITFSVANFSSWTLATWILQDNLNARLAEYGAFATIHGALDIIPKEQVTIFIDARPAVPSGLAMGVEPASPESIREIVRECVDNAGSIEIDDALLKHYKSMMQAYYNGVSSSPEHLMNAVLTRYSEGKNMLENNKKAVASVTAASVSAMLKALETASSVDYTIE